jgi:flagellin
VTSGAPAANGSQDATFTIQTGANNGNTVTIDSNAFNGSTLFGTTGGAGNTAYSSASGAARSQIQDTDYSVSTTQLAKSQILSQASTAMLAQANQSQQNVFSLLKG